MNTTLIIKAVEQLDEAIGLTPDKKERHELTDVIIKLRDVLRRRGIFIGHGQGNLPKHNHENRT